MLAAIEGQLEELFDTVESLPEDKIEAAEKSKDKERRLRMREEKLEEQRLHQEERLRRALERAQAAPTKRVGRFKVLNYFFVDGRSLHSREITHTAYTSKRKAVLNYLATTY